MPVDRAGLDAWFDTVRLFTFVIVAESGFIFSPEWLVFTNLKISVGVLTGFSLYTFWKH